MQSTDTPARVFVVPSDSLATAPAAIAPGATNPFEIAIAYQGNPRGSGQYAPATAMYVATSGSGQLQVYGLNLLQSANQSRPPAAEALGTAYPPGAILCYAYGIQLNYNDPNTLFAIIAVDTSPTYIGGPSFNTMTGRCPANDPISYQTVYYDSSHAAQKLQLTGISYVDWVVQADGQLGGVLLQVGGQLWFYPHGDFAATTAPEAIAPDVQLLPTYIGAGVPHAVYDIGSALRTSGFEKIGFEFLSGTDNKTTLWRVDPSGTATFQYTMQANGSAPLSAAGDTQNVYFADVDTIVGAPSTGSELARILYSNPVADSSTPGVVNVVGSTAGSVVFQASTPSGGTVLAAVPGDASEATSYAPLLTVPPNTSAESFIDPTSATLFVGENFWTQSSPSATWVQNYQSFVGVITSVPSVVGTTKPLVWFQASGSTYFQLHGSHPDLTKGGSLDFSGTTLATFDTSTQAASPPLHDTFGNTFTFPAGTDGYFLPGCLAVIDSNTGAGIHALQLTTPENYPGRLALVDTSRSLVIPVDWSAKGFLPWR